MELRGIELRHLRVFLAVAHELHFRRAAARLGIAQPALSQQIRFLEQSLGARLLNRTTRRVELTAAGEIFARHAERTLEHLERTLAAAQRAARGDLGVVRFGFTASASIAHLPTLLRLIHDELPDVELELFEQPLWTPLEAVENDLLDLVVVRGPVDHPELTAIPLLEEPLAVVTPPGHPLLAHAELSAAQLRDERFVLFRRAYAPELHDFITGLCAQEGFTPRVVREAGEWSVIASLVSAGFGISVAPASVRRAPLGDIGVRPLVGTEGVAKLALVHAPRMHSPAVRRVIQTLVAAARSGALATRD
jgi:DNA-binding transcriptional LysR family regulator